MVAKVVLPVLFAALLFGVSPAKANQQVTFHFYGAYDCPPCMAFKRKHLETVQAEGKALGFSVAVNVINATRDVPKPGAFGDADAILRAAGDDLGYIYPPIFLVTQGGEIIAAYRSDWRAALKDAVTRAQM